MKPDFKTGFKKTQFKKIEFPIFEFYSGNVVVLEKIYIIFVISITQSDLIQLVLTLDKKVSCIPPVKVVSTMKWVIYTMANISLN